MLQREYQILSELDNPFIVRTWGLRNDAQIGQCLILDYVDGVPLNHFLLTKPSHSTRLRIIRELLDAVAYLHAKQIVHKDLKPANILITTNGEHVKLIDFGFSDADSQAVNNLGCTNRYASPEQLNGSTPDFRSDIYTLGRIIREIEPLRYRCTTSRCMRTKPSRRYQDVPSLAKAINRRSILVFTLAFALIAVAGSIAFLNWFRGNANGTPTVVPTPADTVIMFVHDTITVFPVDSAAPVINELHGWYDKAQERATHRIKHLKHKNISIAGIEAIIFSEEMNALKSHYQALHPEFRNKIEQDYLAEYSMRFQSVRKVSSSYTIDLTDDPEIKSTYDKLYAEYDSLRLLLDKNPEKVFTLLK